MHFGSWRKKSHLYKNPSIGNYVNAKLQKSVFDRPEVLLRLQLHFTAAAVMMGEFTDPFHYFSPSDQKIGTFQERKSRCKPMLRSMCPNRPIVKGSTARLYDNTVVHNQARWRTDDINDEDDDGKALKDGNQSSQLDWCEFASLLCIRFAECACLSIFAFLPHLGRLPSHRHNHPRITPYPHQRLCDPSVVPTAFTNPKKIKTARL